MIYDKFYINGQWVTPIATDTAELYNPATEEKITDIPQANESDVDKAVEAAKAAFPAWNESQPSDRIKVVRQILQGIEKRADDFAEAIIKELGSPVSFALQGQVKPVIEEIEALLEEMESFAFEEQINNAKVIKEGFGVVACITPWNYPLLQIERKIFPAILTGNTVVVKPASDTPLAAFLLAEVIDQTDLPAGVFNLITGRGSVAGDALTHHPDVAVLSFTGSTNVGSGMYEAAAPHIKKVILELGGKSALVALPQADQKAAVKQAMDTIINNQGQTCTALTRLLVPKAEYDAYKEVILDYYDQAVVIGDVRDEATTVGSMVSKNQFDTVMEYIDIGKEEGAEILVGGQAVDRVGYYIEPTVFVNVKNDMRIAQEEIFGPVLAVITYETVEEAIELANDTVYGLSGAVVGPKQAEAEDVARKLRTGNIFVNNGARNRKAPFGGYKQSGLGRENGRYGLEDYVEIKALFL